MLFNSYPFLFGFLPIVLFGFQLLDKVTNKSRHLKISWVILSSLFFYGCWNVNQLGVILVSIAVNFSIGKILLKNKHRIYLFVGILFNLILLGYFKYSYFLATNFSLPEDQRSFLQTVVLPLAISFFTFQQIAFLMDVSRGKIEKFSLQEYTFFVVFFPQLIAGPIVHFKEIVPQLKSRDHFCLRWNALAHGTTLFIFGLSKKVLIADNLSTAANAVFDSALRGESLSFYESWVGALSYSLQIYFDFSGYTDMAIGLGLLFSLSLPLNFLSPYQATSLIDFWRRWHVTLSHFLRDYLYIPLGGNRKGKIRRYVNLMLTMLLGGLWHGAGWNFLLWGGLHGFGLIINHGYLHYSKSRIQLPRWLGWSSTFLFVTFAWVFFRGETISSSMVILKSMVSFSGVGDAHIFKSERFSGIESGLFIMLGAVISLASPNAYQISKKIMKELEKKSSISQIVTGGTPIFLGILLALSLYYMYDVTEFLYFNF